ncbi:MAG: hypothetical protein KBA71_02060 [Opitutaceae bacterium]|nr:hypothetical protein [Opitutaceae bacterium]
MKTLRQPWHVIPCALICLGAASGAFAFDKGSTAYSKRAETNLLAEPNALSTAVGKAAFAEALTVTETRGAWLHVKSKKSAGWIFEGNVAATKPAHAPAAGLTTISASATNTVAAARPLSEAGSAYAGRHAGGNARDDLEWLEKTASMTTGAAVEAYLRDNRKGEFRP